VGTGVWSSVDAACQTTVKQTGNTAPDSKTVARYEQGYALYRKLYPALKEISHDLSALS